ncbi:MAG: NADH-quinone oxidoreductase subunit NuoF [Spirochaetia bacterium]|nr:NADH-quinone oxidoreductase subunit NuoF [Spirochaetota bacterium]MDW8111931.1 NADH-quinone oxidoreductase subunit NuoF [Spirochaetia bacterium]
MNVEELKDIYQKQNDVLSKYKHRILICGGASCHSLGSVSFKKIVEDVLAKYDLKDSVAVVNVGCLGLCGKGPLVKIEPEGIIYTNVSVENVADIVERHFVKRTPREDGVMRADDPFYRKQFYIVLKDFSNVDPADLNSYIAFGGYTALAKSLLEMSRQDVIEEVKKSGLRGRGGAGFPTGIKWETVSKQPSETKFVVCNGDEGDPGAFMDRSVMESMPHRLLEGMTIAAYAVGASQGFIYVRAEYPLAIERLSKAIRDARRAGLLGTNIMGTNFSFDISIRVGAGAFVCGEETALLASIEGKRGMPRQRPPFPAEKGLWGYPTLINNVETYANIYAIINNGGDWFASIGTQKSKGTKVFALAGKINNTGLVEVPMGVTIREMIYEIGGGIQGGKKFKAVQTGGPSGGCIPEKFIDLPVDYESLREVGSIMGSGGFIVMDENTCMVDVAKFFMEFCADESCGKCIPCRVGTVIMKDILQKITDGRATMRDYQNLKDLAYMVREMSLCGLGQTAPNPVLSSIMYFEEEYLAHINERRCIANVCEVKQFDVVNTYL